MAIFGLLPLYTWLLALHGPAHAGVLVTMDEALGLAFPDCEVQQQTHYLTHAQRQDAVELAKVPVESALLRQHRATCAGEPGGTAYFDTHLIRGLPSTLMIVVDSSGRLGQVELLSFEGPDERRPPASFYAQLIGLRLGRELALRRSGIDAVSGATLSSKAAVEAGRRVLALHQVVTGEGTE